MCSPLADSELVEMIEQFNTFCGNTTNSKSFTVQACKRENAFDFMKIMTDKGCFCQYEVIEKSKAWLFEITVTVPE